MKRAIFCCLLLALPLLAGCDDSPSEPVVTPVVFNGTVEADGSVSHPLELAEPGLVRLDVLDLRARIIAIDPTIDFVITLGIGLGRFEEDGRCALTFTAIAARGSFFVFGLEGPDLCISLFDAGSLPDDSIIEYTVQASSTD